MKTLKWFAYVFVIVFIVGCGKEDPILDPIPAPTPPGKGGLNGKITDPGFLNILLYRYDANKDGILTQEEAEAVKTMSFMDSGEEFISYGSMKGIEFFTSLESLTCALVDSVDL